MSTFSFKKLIYFMFALLVICLNTRANADEATGVTLDITYRENLKYDGGLPVRLIDSIVPSQTNVVVYLRVFDGTFENGKPVTPWVKVWDNELLHYQLDKVSVINAGSNYNIYSYIEFIPVPVLGLKFSSANSNVINDVYEWSSFKSFAEQGDQLVSINGFTVNTQADRSRELAKYKPGNVVTVGILKSNSTREHKVILANPEIYQ